MRADDGSYRGPIGAKIPGMSHKSHAGSRRRIEREIAEVVTGSRRPEITPGESITAYLDRLDAWKAQGPWVPAAGGSETPFYARSGARLLYVYQPRSGRHAYLDLGTDLILTDEDARLHLGK
jgi:hypothetical protein